MSSSTAASHWNRPLAHARSIGASSSAVIIVASMLDIRVLQGESGLVRGGASALSLREGDVDVVVVAAGDVRGVVHAAAAVRSPALTGAVCGPDACMEDDVGNT